MMSVWCLFKNDKILGNKSSRVSLESGDSFLRKFAGPEALATFPPRVTHKRDVTFAYSVWEWRPTHSRRRFAWGILAFLPQRAIHS